MILALEKNKNNSTNNNRKIRGKQEKCLIKFVYHHLFLHNEFFFTFMQKICALEFFKLKQRDHEWYKKSFLSFFFIIQRFVFLSFSLHHEYFSLKGSSLRSLPSQHCGLYSRQRIQLKELANNSSARSLNFRTTFIRPKSEESKTNGASNTKSPGAETVHLPCWRRISRVINKIFLLFCHNKSI